MRHHTTQHARQVPRRRPGLGAIALSLAVLAVWSALATVMMSGLMPKW